MYVLGGLMVYLLVFDRACLHFTIFIFVFSKLTIFRIFEF